MQEARPSLPLSPPRGPTANLTFIRLEMPRLLTAGQGPGSGAAEAGPACTELSFRRKET